MDSIRNLNLQTPVFDKLRELLDQNQFELTDFGCEAVEGEKRDYSLIYLMNDAVESFLILKNAKATGVFDPESEDLFEYSLTAESERYVLKIKQKAQHFLLFFDDLELKMQLYNYSGIGHFWVKKYEYLRILEYQIAIMRDKLDYLGVDACNEKEQRLAKLKEFPPLNYTCYPSASRQYIFPMEEPWKLSLEAADFMIEIAEKAGDFSLSKILKKYKENPSVRMAKRVASALRQIRHQKTVSELKQEICEAACEYPDRSFGKEIDLEMERRLQKAEAMRKDYLSKGIEAEIYKEEPFIFDCDSISVQVRLMITKKSFWNKHVVIRTID